MRIHLVEQKEFSIITLSLWYSICMKTISAPIPAWFTPAVEMTMKRMAKDSPMSFIEIAKQPDFKDILEARTAELLTKYQQRAETLISDGESPVNAHFIASEEVWGLGE